MAFNLFDFSNIQPGYARANVRSSINPFASAMDYTEGVKMAPAPYIAGTTQEEADTMQRKLRAPSIATESTNLPSLSQADIDEMDELVKGETIQLTEDDIKEMDALLAKSQEKQTIGQMAVGAVSDEAGRLYDTVSGAVKKTGEAFVEGAKQIGKSAYQIKEGLTEGKNIGRPLIEGLTRGVGGVVFSPVSGVVGQAIEGSIAPAASMLTPQVVKDLAKEGFANVQEWYNSQDENTKQLIKDTGLTAEGALNLIGVKASPKVAEAAIKGAANVTKAEIQAGKALVKGATQGAKATGEALATGAKAVGKVPSKIAEGGISLATGISKEAQTAIKKAPNAYEQARKGVITRESQADKVAGALKTRLDDLSDTGKDYQSVRKGAEVANKTELEDVLAKNAGVVKTVNLPIKDRAAIKQVSDYIAERGKTLTDDDLLSLRHNIDTTIGWQEGVSSKGQGIIRGIRNDIDKLAKERIEGLAKLDAKFAPEKKFLDEVRPLILNKDGSLKDNYIQAIANITGKGKEMKLDRLEKIIPGIGDEMRALKAYEEVGNILSMKTGSVTRQIAGATAGGTLGGPLGAAAGYIATNPALYARGLELVGKLGAKNAKKVIPRPLKKSPIIANTKLQSNPKIVQSKKPLISK